MVTNIISRVDVLFEHSTCLELRILCGQDHCAAISPSNALFSLPVLWWFLAMRTALLRRNLRDGVPAVAEDGVPARTGEPEPTPSESATSESATEREPEREPRTVQHLTQITETNEGMASSSAQVELPHPLPEWPQRTSIKL